MDVTTLWYSLFESGTSRRRFSAAFLDRLADVLQLNADDRGMMTRLVLASGHAARDVDGDATGNQWLPCMAELADMSRKLAQSRDRHEALQVVFKSLGAILRSAQPSCTLLVSNHSGLEAVQYDNATQRHSLRILTIALSHAPEIEEVARRGNRPFIVPDVESDMPLARAIRANASRDVQTSQFQARCVLVAPVADDGTLRGVLRIDSPIPNAYRESEAGIAEIVGSQLARILARPSLISFNPVCQHDLVPALAQGKT